MNLVLGGLAFAPGDEIVTTDNEHAGLLEPLAALARRYGVVVRVAEALQGSDPLDAIAALIGPRTRSSRSRTCSGRTAASCRCARSRRPRTRPARPCSWTAPRASERSTSTRPRSAWTPTPGPGQKWLCGPNGVGFLWLADGFEERFEVAAPSYYTRDFRSEGAAVLARRAPARRRLAVDGRRSPAWPPPWSSGASSWAGARAPRRWRACARAASQLLSERAGRDAAGRERGRRAARRVHRGRADRPRTSSRASRQAGVLARTLPGPRLGARLARLLGLRRRSRAPGRRAARRRERRATSRSRRATARRARAA